MFTRPFGGISINVPRPVAFGLIEATSNRGFCTGVCDAAGLTTIANMSIRTTCFIDSPWYWCDQSDSEVRLEERKKGGAVFRSLWQRAILARDERAPHE